MKFQIDPLIQDLSKGGPWRLGSSVTIFKVPAILFGIFFVFVWLFTVIAMGTAGWFTSEWSTRAFRQSYSYKVNIGMVETCSNGVCVTTQFDNCPSDNSFCSTFQAAKVFQVFNTLAACIVFIAFSIFLVWQEFRPQLMFKIMYYGHIFMSVCGLLVVALAAGAKSAWGDQNIGMAGTESDFSLGYSFGLAVVAWIFSMALSAMFWYMTRIDYVTDMLEQRKAALECPQGNAELGAHKNDEAAPKPETKDGMVVDGPFMTEAPKKDQQ